MQIIKKFKSNVHETLEIDNGQQGDCEQYLFMFIFQHGRHGGHLELRNKTESCNKSKSISQTFMKLWK